jgi:hypothetical protein
MLEVLAVRNSGIRKIFERAVARPFAISVKFIKLDVNFSIRRQIDTRFEPGQKPDCRLRFTVARIRHHEMKDVALNMYGKRLKRAKKAAGQSLRLDRNDGILSRKDLHLELLAQDAQDITLGDTSQIDQDPP